VSVLLGLAEAMVVGISMTFIPLGPTQTTADGQLLGPQSAVAAEAATAAPATDGTPDGPTDAGSPSASSSPDVDPGSSRASTSIMTSCGRLLDVIPVEATAAGDAVEVALEVRPVCPSAEWLRTSSLHVELTDLDGEQLAAGTFDLSEQPLYVPGFADAGSSFRARFGPGTAWTAPELLRSGILRGTVLVDCEPLDGATPEPAEETSSGPVSETRSVTAASLESSDSPAGGVVPAVTPAEERRTALAALRRQARADDPAVSALEGSWVPQLSSKRAGTYDAFDGKRFSLGDIYQQFLALRLEYPNVRLLFSTDWDAYTLDGYWVVLAGVPFARAGETNSWCTERGIAASQCFAKRLIRDGAPIGTTRHRG
jgi:hypothetical protein